MAALPYMQLYVADYLADTMHLNVDQHGAYLLLIMNYWQTGRPIPKDRLHKIVRVSKEYWQELEPALAEFFEDDGDCWIHLRIEKDLEAIHTAPRGKKLPGSDSLKGYKGYVYFVTSEDTETVKIGYSKNPWARLSELRRSYGEGLSVVATVKTVEKSEVSVHKLLDRYRLESEWFSKSDCITQLISAINDDVVTTVEGIRDYVVNYGKPPTPPTNTEADTDTDTDTEKQPCAPEAAPHDISAEVISYLNEKANRNYRNAPTNTKLILARAKEGATLDDFKAVIDRKCKEWAGNPGMAQYLRPATLFNAEKFNQYIGQLGAPMPTSNLLDGTSRFSSRHTGFDDRDYSEGLIQGVSDDAANF